MPSFHAAQDILHSLQSVDSLSSLSDALVETTERLGFHYFALTHHVDFPSADRQAVRLHNYPRDWETWFNSNGLGPTDPIHRASHATAFGFRWSRIEELIHLSKRDHHVLAHAVQHGIGEGFTVPGNVPGEVLGSCSFACRAGDRLAEERIALAQIAGQWLFETGRRLAVKRTILSPPTLTDRQIECILWVGRGKTDWEIAQILGVSQATVIEHLRNARARYDAPTRSMLTVRALYDGALSFTDLVR
ncbi:MULTISPECIES: LuxR family transcriptional regulator [unclassified Sphingomonas]|uniref:helix-turn-helix transcriptional regulator n=1 Tax=unclassified Sphingomonas TaxID=196159 RepID=UPI002150DC7A|nr:MULTISPECIES: LuxR family transcriptional regulator [unclassified Sphingomonas]MCR5869483.1 LuxR family transcriptional regulator [Sphingomonas sp. J344]UUX98790.1 LuxR family transcriptional regulator [Sphingomonas sp. J315]